MTIAKRGSRKDAAAAALLAHVAIVLNEPKYPENIGAAARVATNMGISHLIVVSRQRPEEEPMRKLATHHAAHLIEALVWHESLAEALAPFAWVVGTTARQGRQRRNFTTPREMGEEIVPLLGKNRVALLFGPEDRGLTNEDLAFCNMLTTIPTAAFSSLNLAQAVAIHCYEVYSAVQAAAGEGRKQFRPKLAESRELEAMYLHVEEVLRTIGFLKETDYEYWMRSVRDFLGRLGLRAGEARTVRGFCRQFLWYDRKRGG
jgi:tRNA/rRNA methyltransferase